MTIVVVATNGTAIVTPCPIAIADFAVARAAFEASIVSTQ